MREQGHRLAPHHGSTGGRGAVRIRIATSLQAVEGAWRALEGSAFCTPFQTYDWLSAYVQAADTAARREIAIVVVSSDSKLRMIVPLALERRWGASYLRWLGHDVNDYNAPIIDLTWARALTHADMQAIWSFILAELPPADYVHIERQPALLEDCLNPFRHLAATSDTRRAYAIALAGAWPRQDRRENMDRPGTSGRVRLRRVRRQAEQRAVLRRLISWKRRELQAGGRSNPFADGRFERFLAAAITAAGRHGALRLFVLEADTSIAAVALCLAGRSDLNLFVAAYDAQTGEDFSAAALMTARLMEMTARSGRRALDLSHDDAPWMRDWKVNAMELVVTQWPLSLKGHVVKALESARLGAVKWVMRREGAVHFARRLRRRWNRLRQGEGDAGPSPRGPDAPTALHNALYERLTSRHLMQ